MNKQVSCILTANLIIAAFFTGGLLISKLPTVIIGDSGKDNGWCGTPETGGTVVLSGKELSGKSLFQSKCAACHSIFKDLTGPALRDFEARGPWSDRRQLYKWIRNPEAFMKTDTYTSGLKKKFGSMMTAFPDITDEEIDAIAEYIQ